MARPPSEMAPARWCWTAAACFARHRMQPHRYTNPVIHQPRIRSSSGTNTGLDLLRLSPDPFRTSGSHKLTIANKGWNTTIFGVRLLDSGNINWPIVVGDPAYDRPGGRRDQPDSVLQRPIRRRKSSAA